MGAQRPLLHLPALAAAGTALYAASLAFVTGQQSAADARVVADRAPILQAGLDAAAHRQRVTAALRQAADALAAASDAYNGAAASSGALDGALLTLADSVQAATGAAARLPDRVVLPAPQTRVVTVTTAAPPPVQATTGASGAAR